MMNIDTDTQFAFAEAVGAYVKQHGAAFEDQISPETGQPLKNLYDPQNGSAKVSWAWSRGYPRPSANPVRRESRWRPPSPANRTDQAGGRP